MKLKKYFGKLLQKSILTILTLSLKKAANQQGLVALREKLATIVPDISSQYSNFQVDSAYLELKVRNLHAFQISLVDPIIKKFKKIDIVDIGDSAGTHLQYILGLYSKTKEIKCLSVNIDQKAIERIKSKGLEAVNARVEELDKYNIHPDIFLCFEVLEHLMDPCRFLYELSTKTKARFLIVTVPYLKKSRVGLHQIRGNRLDTMCAENTHIFELSPQDWKLLMKQAGWNIVREQVYLQYPTKSILRITGPFWRKFDFEGFYGVILTRDNTWSSKYLDW